MMVCSGRLPPPASFGWPGVSVKPAPRFWKLMPKRDEASPEPKPW